MNKTTTAFTIVELLIVIIIIAILATISIATYTNIQNRANDSVIQSDITNMAKQIRLDSVTRGSFILGGSATGDSTRFSVFRFRPTKSAYSMASSNLFYCTGTVDGVQIFRIGARSKSDNVFSYDSESGLRNVGKVNLNATTLCNSEVSGMSYSYGYYATQSRWWGWTD